MLAQLQELLSWFSKVLFGITAERAEYWFNHKKEFVSGLEKLFNGEASASSAFKLWRTVKLGVHKSINAYRKALKKAKMEVGTWASDIMGKSSCTVSAEEREADLVIVSGHDLGFTEAASRKDIYEKAKSIGLELCPAEVGPALRLAYIDQPYSEYLLIGMEPISDSDDFLSVFLVSHVGVARWLNGHDGFPDFTWDPGFRWVFVLPRK